MTDETASAATEDTAAADAQAVDGAVKAEAAEGAAQDVKADAAADGDKAGADKVEDAKPAPLTLTAPEGAEVFADQIEAFAGFASEIGLTQEVAEKLVARQIEIAKGAEAERASAIAKWAEDAKADPEIGGAKFEASAAAARKAVQAFGDDALTELLDASGLVSHPAMIRVFARIGAKMGDSKFEIGASVAPSMPRSDAAVLFGGSGKENG